MVAIPEECIQNSPLLYTNFCNTIKQFILSLVTQILFEFSFIVHRFWSFDKHSILQIICSVYLGMFVYIYTFHDLKFILFLQMPVKHGWTNPWLIRLYRVFHFTVYENTLILLVSVNQIAISLKSAGNFKILCDAIFLLEILQTSIFDC